jgi:hypothetical protein
MSNSEKSMANEATDNQDNMNGRSNSKTSKSKGKQKGNKANNTPQSPQKLTLATLSDSVKQLDTWKEVILEDVNGNKHKINIRNKFLPSKIQQYILDVKEALLILKSDNVSLQDLNKVLIVNLMCVFKYFTDLPISHIQLNKKRNISKLFDVASALMDLGIFEDLYLSFDESERQKLDEFLVKSETLGKDLGEIMIAATLNEQEKLRKLGLEFVGDSVVEDIGVGEGETSGDS